MESLGAEVSLVLGQVIVTSQCASKARHDQTGVRVVAHSSWLLRTFGGERSPRGAFVPAPARVRVSHYATHAYARYM
eukprot:COSAG02_NODE_5116_length_4614_cov_6.958140_1_plen_77_part_00